MNGSVVQPGGTIGVLGSGQLGRMISVAATRMGYHVVVYSPDSASPAGQVSDDEITASYEDQSAVEGFARRCDVITLEFENVPVQTVRWANAITPVCPGERVLETAQDRIIEKSTLSEAGLPVTPFHPVLNHQDLLEAVDRLGLPIVLKTARSGYDGKGQQVLRQREQLQPAILAGGDRFIAEQMIDFEREVSILVFRGAEGEVGTFPLIENQHANHILDHSTCPASCDAELAAQIREIAVKTAEQLDLIGLLCIELFIHPDGTPLINEIAPRPHNSGHLTIESFSCCQFQQLVRAVCGLPLGTPTQIRPAAMANLLGDLWAAGDPPFDRPLSVADVSLHLYGKTSAKPGRKMGHLTATAATADSALETVLAARHELLRR